MGSKYTHTTVKCTSISFTLFAGYMQKTSHFIFKRYVKLLGLLGAIIHAICTEMCSESEDSSSSPPKARTKPQVLTAKTDHPHQRRGYKVLRKRGTGGNHVTSKVTSAQDDRRRRSDLLRQSRQQQEKPPTVQVGWGE